MSTVIQLKRGTLNDILNANLNPGEPTFSLDTKDLIVSDGTNRWLIGRVENGVLADRPNFGRAGKLYYATDTEQLFLDTGSEWIQTNSNTWSNLDDIPDGTSYVKSHNDYSDIEKQKTQDAYDHISNDGSDHSFINQSVTTTSIPTFNQVVIANSPSQGTHVVTVDYLKATLDGRDPQESVLSESTLNPNSLTPSNGDRYLILGIGAGDWVNHDNEIAEYNGTGWDFTAPNPGYCMFVEDAGYFRLYNSSNSWIKFGSAVDHNSLLNVQGIGSEYYHLSLDQYTLVTQYASSTQSGLLHKDDYVKIPTTDEKNALGGTSGTPSSSNKFVTNSDTRLSDARTPLTHASTHKHGGSDEIATSTPTVNAIPKADSSGTLNQWITIIDGGTA